MFIINHFLSIIAPHECLSCRLEGSLLCRVCQIDSCPPLPERCYRCHRLSPDSRVCQACRRHSKLRYVWVRTAYAGLAKDLVHAFKFERAQDAARPIAELTVTALPYIGHDTIVTFVPTASTRYRQRGYDQAALLAQELAKQLQLTYMPLLRRTGQSRQVGAKRAERLEQLRGAYHVKNPRVVMNRAILLIDDITTTGATLETAAAALKAAGAKSVCAAVFAQKQ